MQRAAAARLTLAQALAAGDQRSPAEVLLDAVGTADVLLRQAKVAAIDAGDPVPVEVLDELVGAVGRAATLARIARDAGLTADTLTTDQVVMLEYAMVTASAALGMNVSSPRVRAAVASALRGIAAVGPEAEVRARALAGEVKRVRQAADVVAERERVELRTGLLGELRRDARSGRCPVCSAGQLGIEGPTAERPVDGPGGAPSGPSSEDRIAGQRPVQRAGGADVKDADVVESRPPVRATAEVVRSVSGYGSCPGCGLRTGSDHDAVCGYPLAASRHGGGW